MRMIGQFETEQAARTFSDFLFLEGVGNEVDRDATSGPWSLWILAEDDVDKAREWLAGFLADPKAARFQDTAGRARELRQSQEREEVKVLKKHRTARELFPTAETRRPGFATIGLIVGVALVYLWSDFARHMERVVLLFISESVYAPEGTLHSLSHLTEIRSGQLWRLLTPVFIHFTFAHIFFNLLWLLDLGTMMEKCLSPWRLLLFVVIVGIGSNLAQYLVSGPVFGGMSGVIYGLLGYAWQRGRLDPASGFILQRSTVIMMLIWLVICYTGLVGNIANTAHTAGLILGILWGLADGSRARRA